MKSMFIRTSFVTVLLCLGALNSASSQAALTTAFPNLTFFSPVALCASPDSTNRIFVTEQGGTIKVFPNSRNVSFTKTFLDLSSSIVTGGEMGLLSIAFHPNYKNNGFFYVYYNVDNHTAGFPYASVISRFRVSTTNPDSALRSSEVVIMRVNQPYPNHKGGQLVFGPDGYLYLGLGDGGSGGDPQGNGQNLQTLLGKMVRIDVDGTSPGKLYAIPPANPFADDSNLSIMKEIFATGLRNPWRFGFDPATGRLWVGDVGQNAWEEIDTIANGGNYGWNTMEGTHCYNPSSGCDSIGLRMPLLDYEHINGNCSVTGGYVYRGKKIPALRGSYLYGDFCTGTLWAFDVTNPATNHVLLNTGFSISTFGVDQNKNMYVIDYNAGVIHGFAALTPDVPVLKTPSKGATSLPRHLRLIWNRSSNAGRYDIQVATDSGFSSIAFQDTTGEDTSIVPSGLAYGATYYWRVSATNEGGTSAYSGFNGFTTIDSTAPPLPVLISPAAGSTDEPSILSLTWSPSATAERYHFQLANDSVFSTIVVDDSMLVDTTRQIGPLASNTVYYWRVSASNEPGSSGYGEVRSFRTAVFSSVLSLARGWNLVSNPLMVPDAATTTLLPGAISQASRYNTGSGYVQSDSLTLGIGYWIKYPSAQSVAIAGTPVMTDSVSVSAGWNLIGSLSSPVPVSLISSDPPGMTTSQFFGYATRYISADTIHPGSGYWVKSGSDGKLILSTVASSSPVNRIHISTSSIRARSAGIR